MILNETNNTEPLLSSDDCKYKFYFASCFVLGAIIMIENSLTIILVCRFSNLRTKTNAILTSLAVVDFLTGLALTMQPFLVCYLPVKVRCELLLLSTLFLLISSVFHLMAVTLDRYVAILYPLHYHAYFTRSRVTLCLMACWIVPATTFGILAILTFIEKYETKFDKCFLLQIPAFIAYTCLSILLFSILMIMTLYICIFREIHKQHRLIQAQTLPANGNIKSEVKTSRTLFLTVGCFILCWLPMIVLILVGLVDKETIPVIYHLHKLTDFARLLAILNSGMNPLIYIIRMKQFRMAYNQLFHCFVCAKEN